MEKVSYYHDNLLSRGGIALVGQTGGGKTTLRKILKEAMSFEPVLNILQHKYLVTKGSVNEEFICSVTEMTRKQIITSKVNLFSLFHLLNFHGYYLSLIY